MKAAARSGFTTSDFFEQARELARPIAVYWAFLGVMFGSFCIAAMIDSPDLQGMMVLGCFGLVTFTCVLAGQVLALLRVRDWIVMAIWAFTWTFGMTFGIIGAAAVGAAAPPLAILIFCYIFLGPMFLVGGVWSLSTGRALFATWVPLIYATGTAIIMAENKGKVATWMAGSKWAVWDVFTFGVLGVGIAFLLAYLVFRETHRLHLWRRSARGPLRGSVTEGGAARPRLSCVGWMLLCVLAGGLAVGTAAVAPFLWRTGPGDEEGDHEHDGGEHEGKHQGKKGEKGDRKGQKGEGKGERKPCKGSTVDCVKERVKEAAEDAEKNLQPAASEGIDLLATLITLLLMALAALLFGYRPIKRLLLVRHLRDPLWKVPPTRRIEHGWRLVEIAMGDAGVEPRVNEPAGSLCQRGLPTLRRVSPGGIDVHGLADAAAIRDRIAYGLGLAPGDVELMEKVAHWAYDTVWDRLGDRGQLKAMYRGL